jgi:glutamyl-tRNA synthetase
MSSRPVKLRFAPSPTGYLHVGGARTAIFNWLHARRHGGSFLLRIEDTDVERSRQHHAEQIVASLGWLGIPWDEGPIYQSDRLHRYRERAGELVLAGKAYRCFCSVEELEAERAAAEKAGAQYRYSGRCRQDGSTGNSDAPHVIRFQIRSGLVGFHDLIRGDVEFDAATIDDFVLIRSDGNPTYHLSVVVDDIDMEITIVARGDDHLSNTPKHILLFEAFGAEVPHFAHLPLILGSDRKRLSKRTGATSVEEFQALGILPEALFNFLTLLGWAPGGDQEIISVGDAVERFDLSEVNKAAAVFDLEKLLWLNGQYIHSMTAEQIEPHLRPFLQLEIPPDERLKYLITLHQPRARTLREMAEQIVPFYSESDEIAYEEDAVRKHLKGDGLVERLSELRERFASLESFEIDTTEAALRQLAEKRGESAGKYIHPLRVALTGKMASPPIFDVAVAWGRERTLARLDRLIDRLREGTIPE